MPFRICQVNLISFVLGPLIDIDRFWRRYDPLSAPRVRSFFVVVVVCASAMRIWRTFRWRKSRCTLYTCVCVSLDGHHLPSVWNVFIAWRCVEQTTETATTKKRNNTTTHDRSHLQFYEFYSNFLLRTPFGWSHSRPCCGLQPENKYHDDSLLLLHVLFSVVCSFFVVVVLFMCIFCPSVDKVAFSAFCGSHSRLTSTTMAHT